MKVARIWIGAAIAGALVLGCKSPTLPTIIRIQRIDIAPARVSLLPFQAAYLTISLTTNGGGSGAAQSVQGLLQWSTTGGLITSNELLNGVRYVTYTAPAQPGNYLFIVTTTNGVPVDTASIAVTATPVPVHAVAITPGNASLALGETSMLSATLTDETGSVLFGRAIDWSSSDAGVATVLATGMVRAIAAGTTTITATSEGHSGTSIVTVKP